MHGWQAATLIMRVIASIFFVQSDIGLARRSIHTGMSSADYGQQLLSALSTLCLPAASLNLLISAKFRPFRSHAASNKALGLSLAAGLRVVFSHQRV